MSVPQASPASNSAQASVGAQDSPELLERLRGPEGADERDRIVTRLKAIEADLSRQAMRFQSAERIRQIESGRLAVACALSIISRIEIVAADGSGDSSPVIFQRRTTP